MSNLENHAKEELQRAGLFDKDSDYNGMLGDAVMELIKVFADQGHSGFSAMQTLRIFNRVAQFKTLTPISSDPSEWVKVTEYGSPNDKPLWQNRRNSSCFSHDGGKTWYDIDEREKNKWFRLKRRIRWFFQDIIKLLKRPFKKIIKADYAAIEKCVLKEVSNVQGCSENRTSDTNTPSGS